MILVLTRVLIKQLSRCSNKLTGFEGNVVIAIVNHDSDEGDIRSVNRICAIGIEIVPVVVVLEIRVIDVDVLYQDLAGMDERHRPHLALHKLDALNDRVGQTVEGDLVRTAWIIADCSVRVVPDLAVAVESPSASRAVHVDPVATENESGGLALVAHRERVRKPVRDVGAPEQSASDVNLDVRQTSNLHDRVDVVWQRLVSES